jgi:membrane protease YdiL (CAAX protease family)
LRTSGPAQNGGRPWLRPELVASWGEIAGVLLVLFAPFVATSAWAASRGSQTHFVQTLLSNRHLLLNGALEASILGLGLVYFHLRGWKPADLRIRPGVSSSLQGVGLLPLTLGANALVVFSLFWLLYVHQYRDHTLPGFLRFIIANSPQLHHLHAGDLSWPVLVVAMILNAYLEEIVCTAYAFNQFAAKHGPLFALVLIVALRTACHTYQGVIHALGIGSAFLIYGLWYWRTRNLWTLIFAHALLDLVSTVTVKLLHP